MGCTQNISFFNFCFLSAHLGLCMHSAFLFSGYFLQFLQSAWRHSKSVSEILFLCASPHCGNLIDVGCLPLLLPVTNSHSLSHQLCSHKQGHISRYTIGTLVWILDVTGILKAKQTWPVKNTCTFLFCSDLMLFLILVNCLICLFESKQMDLGRKLC